ncbi:8852_t:CDS:2 [Ambispora gerdemannii]|uniref:8852_t:CDS:1 n=1 Tax=Ambispora gerdemannii TaxID=144530 RepID=A0A9N8WQK6_9GLOM|nr:8852_t:CDS:2 [Ambispora gerdemannii]
MTNSSTNYGYLTDNEIQILQQCPYQLTLSIDELTKSKRFDFDNPPRPQNSWIIFRKDYEANLRCRSPDIKQEVKHTAQVCSLKWRQLSSEVKHYFKILEKIACENHKRIYPNYKYKPRNAKDSNIKKWVFREQIKYTLPMSTSMSDNLSQEIVRSPSLNDTLSTIEYNNTIITASTIIDDIHPSTINTNNDAGNSVNNAFNEIISLDQFLLSGNVDINVNNAGSAAIDDIPPTINTSNDVGNSITLYQFPFLSGNFDINVNTHADSTTFDHLSINTDTNNDVGNSIDNSSQLNQIRHQPLISQLPSMINANSPTLPSTNNGSLLINAGKFDNDILEIIAKYYDLDDMND